MTAVLDNTVRERTLRYKRHIETGQTDKIGHALKRLKELEMTLEILSETGIGKSVNKLRTHDKYGRLAEKIVEVWKKLAFEGGVRKSKKTSLKTPQDSKTRSKLIIVPEEPMDPLPDADSIAEDARETSITGPMGFSGNSGLSFEAILAMNDGSSKRSAKHKSAKAADDNNCVVSAAQNESVDWSKYLPKIDVNYRPPVHHLLPSNDTKNGRKHIGDGDDAELDAALFAAKRNKTRTVYSGSKRRTATSDTAVPSLFTLCLRVIADNIDAVEDTGDVPFEILKPALERATPAQLFYIEERNPSLIEADSDQLWKRFCQREFRDQPKKDDSDTWRTHYQRCLSERESRLEALKSRIGASTTANATPVRTTLLADAKAPRDIRRKQAKYGTAVAPKNLPDAMEVRQMRRGGAQEQLPSALKGPKTAVAMQMQALNHNSSKLQKLPPQRAPMMVKALKMFKKSRR